MSVVSLVLVASCAVLGASASSAERQATQWLLRSHTGNPDELAELNRENPMAYALVKALLTKRSLGLLDPNHPTASFVGAGKQRPQRAAPGAEAFALAPGELRAAGVHASLAESGAEVVAVPYAQVQPSAHHDWLNWKSESASDDATTVQNVLGAVAELKGNKAGLLSTHRSTNENALAADEQAFAPEAPAAPVKPVKKTNSYLAGMDLSGDMPKAAASTAEVENTVAPAKKTNSYLDGLDLTGDMPKAGTKKISQAQGSSKNFLASFSWNDEKPKEETKSAQPEIKANSKDANLLSWLGVVKKEPMRK